MRLALITGGSKGLGKALVEHYNAQGWQVKEFSRSGNGPNHIDCDFSDPFASANTIRTTFTNLSKHGWTEIILINNVGTLAPIGPINLDEVDDWQKNIHINISSHITATGLFLKSFDDAECQRHVVNISSGAANNAYYGWSLYCAAKAAIEAFTRCVAVEQSASSNPTTAIIINPGVIDTAMQASIRTQSKDRFEDVERFQQLARDEHLRKPQEVAKAIYSIMDSSPKAGESYNVADFV